MFTSALKKVDVAVFDAIKAAQADQYTGGQDITATVKTGGVGIGKLNAEAQKYAGQVKEIQDKLAAEEIQVPDTVK